MGHDFHCHNCKQYQWVVNKAHFDIGYYPITCLACGESGIYRLDIVRRFQVCSHERFDQLQIPVLGELEDKLKTCVKCHLNVLYTSQNEGIVQNEK